MQFKFSSFIILCIFILFNFASVAQNQMRIDSLSLLLSQEKETNFKVDLLNHLSLVYNDVNILQLKYAQQAESLAIKLTYQKGKLEAIANQGFYYLGQIRNPVIAKTFFNKTLLKDSITSKKNLLIANISFKIGTFINENSKTFSATPYLQIAFKNFEGDSRGVALTCRELAIAYAFARNKDSAFYYLSTYSKYAQQSTGLPLADFYALSSRLYGEFFNDEVKQTVHFKKAVLLFEELKNSKTNQFQIYCNFAQLHATKGNINWLKNQLADLKQNSFDVLKICNEAEKYTRNPSQLNQLRWTAYAYLIRSSIKGRDLIMAEKYTKEGLAYFEHQKDSLQLGKLLWTIESSWWRFAEYFNAYEFQQKELDIWDKLGNKYWKCIGMANIAMVFGRLGDHQRQIRIIQELNSITKANHLIDFTLYAYKDLAKSFLILNKIDSAKYYIDLADFINRENENPFITMLILYTNGLVNEKMDNYDQAISFLYKALAIKTKYAYPINTYDQVAPENALARIYAKKKDFKQALRWAFVSLRISEKENMKDMQSADYLTLATIYKHQKKYMELANCYEKHIALNQDLAKDEAEKAIHRKEISIINQKSDLERKLLMRETDLKNADLKFQKTLNWTFFVVFFIFAFLVYNLYKSYKQKIKDNFLLTAQKTQISLKNDELNELNEEILAQRDSLFVLNQDLDSQHEKLMLQNKMIVLQQKDIIDSIEYASRIQNAMIPSLEELYINFPESFVLFLPRDIVSGDFYWIKQVKNQLYILVADCTGHGVPGAFMSMLGISLMNEMITSRHLDCPGDVLTELRKRLKRSMHQNNALSDSQDGMDASLILIDLESRKLQFAGAYNPLYIIRGSKVIENDNQMKVVANNMNELLIIEADRMPIGVHPKDGNTFANSELMLEKGDSLYLFSDGFVSQFGGPKGAKFKTKPFKELLLGIQSFSMEKQKEVLKSELLEWQGREWEQVDDILVMGIKV